VSKYQLQDRFAGDTRLLAEDGESGFECRNDSWVQFQGSNCDAGERVSAAEVLSAVGEEHHAAIRDASARQLFTACSGLTRSAARELSTSPDSERLRSFLSRVERLVSELLALEADAEEPRGDRQNAEN
jgi:hypothetical protein